jgi:hypothetical protein
MSVVDAHSGLPTAVTCVEVTEQIYQGSQDNQRITMGEMRNAYKTLKERDHFRDLGKNGMIVLK